MVDDSAIRVRSHCIVRSATQLGEKIARAIPYVNIAAATATGISIGAAMGEARFDATVNEAALRAWQRAIAQASRYLSGVIGDSIVTCSNFDHPNNQPAIDDCIRTFVNTLQSKYYIEQSGGKAANINDAAKTFDGCLEAACNAC